jgi:hypothetical protein
MHRLPIHIIQYIQNFGDTKSQIVLCSSCKKFKNDIFITNIDLDIQNDEMFNLISKRFNMNVIRIDIAPNITYKVISTIKPKYLNANTLTTDKWLEHMDLYELVTADNEQLTDKSILINKNLKSLYVTNSPNITDKSICQLDLDELGVYGANNITDATLIANKNITKLYVNSNITDEIVSKLKLKMLEICLDMYNNHQIKITGKSINNMDKLEILRLIHIKKIDGLCLKSLISLRELSILTERNIENYDFYKQLFNEQLNITEFICDDPTIIKYAIPVMDKLELLQLVDIDMYSSNTLFDIFEMINTKFKGRTLPIIRRETW